LIGLALFGLPIRVFDSVLVAVFAMGLSRMASASYGWRASSHEVDKGRDRLDVSWIYTRADPTKMVRH